MRDITIGQGATIRESVTFTEDGADTVWFIATNGTTNIIEEDFPVVDNVADIVVTDTLKPAGDYDYYYKIVYDDNSIDYIPNLEDCDGDCEFPELTICEVPGVS